MRNASTFILDDSKVIFSSAAASSFPLAKDSHSSSLRFLLVSHNQRSDKLFPRVCKHVVCGSGSTGHGVQTRYGKHFKRNWKPGSLAYRNVKKKMKPCKESENKEFAFSQPSEDSLSRLFEEQPLRLHNSFPAFQCRPQEWDMNKDGLPGLSMRHLMECRDRSSQTNHSDGGADSKRRFSTRLLKILSIYAKQVEINEANPGGVELQFVKDKFEIQKLETFSGSKSFPNFKPQNKPAIGTEKRENFVGEMPYGTMDLFPNEKELGYHPHSNFSDRDSLGYSNIEEAFQSELSFLEETDLNSSDEDLQSKESKQDKDEQEVSFNCMTQLPEIEQAFQSESSSSLYSKVITSRPLSRSSGSRSRPSKPSIPGLYSKYSKLRSKAKQLETHEKPLCVLPKFDLMTEKSDKLSVNGDNVTSEDTLDVFQGEEKELEFDWLESDDDDILDSNFDDADVKFISHEREIPLKIKLSPNVETTLRSTLFSEVENCGILQGSGNPTKRTVEKGLENTEYELTDSGARLHKSTKDSQLFELSDSNVDCVLEEAKSIPGHTKSLGSGKISKKSSCLPVTALYLSQPQKYGSLALSNKGYKFKGMRIQPQAWYNREECEKRMLSSYTEPKTIHQLPASVKFVEAPPWKNLKFPNLPFQFEYSYSEIPKSPILGFRDHCSPFAPVTMGRPWTGGPLTKPKMLLNRSFDPVRQRARSFEFSFNRKRVPPEKVKSRTEILGQPLSDDEVVQLVRDCHAEKRQVNLGRDGLTHNMLHLVHNHWKHRPVCRIKCRGPPTLDMDNVCFHVEDKTGGQIIYRAGCVLYVFRGRHYSYRYHSVLPFMLYKPSSAVYPKLVPQAPDGLTIEQARELRVLGQKVKPLIKLRKHGAFPDLVEHVRNAFMLDDLVSLDYDDLKPADYRKIGAKLMELVPCVLLSFRNHRLVLWKGKNTVPCSQQAPSFNAEDHSSVLEPGRDGTSAEISFGRDGTGAEISLIDTPEFKQKDSCSKALTGTNTASHGLTLNDTSMPSPQLEEHVKFQPKCIDIVMPPSDLMDEAEPKSEEIDTDHSTEGSSVPAGNVEGLWDRAVKDGAAVQLEGVDLEADLVLQIAMAFSEVAPAGPEFTKNLPYASRLQGLCQRSDKPFLVRFRQKRDTLRKSDRKRPSLHSEAKVKRRPDVGYPLEALTRVFTEH